MKKELLSQLKELSKVRNIEQAKAWWNALTVRQKAMVVAIIAGTITLPLASAWAAKLTSTHFVADAGVLYLIETSSPFWTKFLFAVGVTTGVSYVAYKTTEVHYNSMVESLGEI